MSFDWRLVPIIVIILVIGQRTIKGSATHNWQVLEDLAEQHPYIVAILDHVKNYSCTGSIINKRTILTSGICVTLEPKYVAVGVAFISYKSTNNIIRVAYTILHEDYSFELKSGDQNITKMHSNIGLVFVVEPILQLFISKPEIGNYYASELKDKIIVVVGYGLLTDSKAIGLQQQIYYQSPCSNPKWYYCICGTEYSAYSKTYGKREFGKGAPVLLGNEIIGITASPFDMLSIKPIGTNFNIFTVMGPYMSWIDKTELNSTFSLRTSSNSNWNKPNNCLQALLICIKLFI